MLHSPGFAELSLLPTPECFRNFTKDIDPEWLGEALASTGTATARRRRLPAEQVVWLVVGMALFRDRSIAEVARSLDLALPGRDGVPDAAPSAVSQARSRLGDKPMEWLFDRCASDWAHASARRDTFNGLALYGVDGTTLRVPDSDENREHFGLASGARGPSGYPLVRVVALMALRSHILSSVSFGPYKQGEHHYAGELWDSLPDHSLCINDKNFLAANLLIPLHRDGENRRWLVPARSTTKYEVLEDLGDGDQLVQMKVSYEARKKDPTLPKLWTVRAIRYQRKGFPERVILTSMTDSELFLKNDIVELYHERWEIELGYGEIKTDMMNITQQPLRSQSPKSIRQEVWGLLLAYNLVRLEMERIANEANVAPTRISFTMAYNFICNELTVLAFTSPGAIPKRLKTLRKNVARFVLPERRSQRSYPRAVKVKMSNYKKKRRDEPKNDALPDDSGLK